MTRRRIDHSRQRAMAAVELLYGDSREKLLEQEWEGENNC